MPRTCRELAPYAFPCKLPVATGPIVGVIVKRLLALFVVAILVFYVAWPAWSGYRLATALSNKDAGTLESTVDFPSVRESLRPAVTDGIDKRMTKEIATLGPLGQALGGDVKKQMLPQLVEQVLSAIVTPDNVIRIAHEGGDMAASVEKILADAAGQLGAVAGAPAESGSDGNSSASGGPGGVLGQVLGAAGGAGTAAGGGGDLAGMAGKVLGGLKKPAGNAPASSTAPAAKRSFGLGNIKGFGFAGPLGFNVAVARDASQANADGTLGMSFTGGSWKLTRVIPNL